MTSRGSFVMRLIGVAIFILIALRVDWRRVFGVLNGSNITLLAISVLLLLPLIAIKVWRWQTILKMHKVSYPYLYAFRATLAATYLSLVTPGRAGDLARAAYLNRERQVNPGLAVSGIVLDRLFDLALSTIVALIGVFAVGLGGNLALSIEVATGLLVIGVLVVLNRRIVGPLSRLLIGILPPPVKRYLDDHQGIHTALGAFYSGVDLVAHPRVIWPLLLSLMAYVILFLHAYLLAQALYIPVSFFQIAFAVCVANLASTLPISIAGLGTRDGAFILIFGLFGMRVEQALAFSLMFLLVFVAFVGLWGAWMWFRDPLDLAAILARPHRQHDHVTE